MLVIEFRLEFVLLLVLEVASPASIVILANTVQVSGCISLICRDIISEVFSDRREISFVVDFSLCGLELPISIFDLTSRKVKVALQIAYIMNRAETKLKANTRYQPYKFYCILNSSTITHDYDIDQINSCVKYSE